MTTPPPPQPPPAPAEWRLQRHFAQALLDPAQPAPAGLRTWNGSDPQARLAVHRNNVVSSLVDALADTFPVVQHLVGVEFFRALASVFVRQAPPQARVLVHYGHDLPAFIEQFEPAQALPYLADMARLEAARVRAYHAADADRVPDAAVTQALGLAMAGGEGLSEWQLGLHPSLQTLASPFSVVTLWAAHQGAGEFERLDIDTPESAWVLRDGLDVLVLPVPAGACTFAQALQAGRTLGEAATAALAAAPAFDLSAALALLLRHGALVAFHAPDHGPTPSPAPGPATGPT